jgi:hypothetical protein
MGVWESSGAFALYGVVAGAGLTGVFSLMNNRHASRTAESEREGRSHEATLDREHELDLEARRAMREMRQQAYPAISATIQLIVPHRLHREARNQCPGDLVGRIFECTNLRLTKPFRPRCAGSSSRPPRTSARQPTAQERATMLDTTKLQLLTEDHVRERGGSAGRREPTEHQTHLVIDSGDLPVVGWVPIRSACSTQRLAAPATSRANYMKVQPL